MLSRAPDEGKCNTRWEGNASEGYGRKVVVAHDICAKHRLEKFGGHGYSYMLDHIAPRILYRGFTPEGVHDILVSNPAEVLTFR